LILAWSEVNLLVRGRDLRTRRPVLIKAFRSDRLAALNASGLPAEGGTAEVRRARHHLQTERRLLVRLRNQGDLGVPHPNDFVYDTNPLLDPECPEAPQPLATALDPALRDTEPYLVLEYLPGRTLDAVLARDYPNGMPEDSAVALLVPVIETLAALHEPWTQSGGRSWHCVYQDLKPANLLIDPLGRATLLDFGGCQIVVDGVPVLEGCWTPGYGPPECEGPARVLLPCADVFCIGTTLLHMLTGRAPRSWRGAIPGRAGTSPDWRRLVPHISPTLREVLEGCLAPRPSDRFGDARRVLEALRHLDLDPARTRPAPPTPAASP
jgi:serine/threonine protein kinase